MLTKERLQELLIYNTVTGIFTWKVNRRGTAKAGTVAGRPNNKGYIDISIDGKRYKAHRLAWLYITGSWPENQIDHINRIRDDNRLANLRDVTQSENLRNCGVSKSTASGIKNVYKSGNGWWSAKHNKYYKNLEDIPQHVE